MKWARFLYAAALGVLLSMTSDVRGQQCTARPRKEIRNLSTEERNQFFDAIIELQQTRGPKGYDKYAPIHVSVQFTAHGFPFFLPWHRAFQYVFEKDIQSTKAGKDMMVPYWAWSYDSQQPHNSIIFSDDWLGGDGAGRDRCVPNGRFKDWTAIFPRRSARCLYREFNNKDGTIPPFSTPEVIATITENSNYAQFCSTLESPSHASVHVGVGGGFVTMSSPNDPLFWLVHGYVDMVWAYWQSLKPEHLLAYEGMNNGNRPARLDDAFQIFEHSFTVRSVMDTYALCYYYEPYRGHGGNQRARRSVSGAAAPTLIRRGNGTEDAAPEYDDHDSPTDSLELIELKAPNPLPVEYILRNNRGVEEVRALEAQEQETIRQLNALPGYISETSLIRRVDLLHAEMQRTPHRRLVATQQNQQWAVPVKSDTPLSVATQLCQKLIQQIQHSSNTGASEKPKQATLTEVIGSVGVGFIQATLNI